MTEPAVLEAMGNCDKRGSLFGILECLEVIKHLNSGNMLTTSYGAVPKGTNKKKGFISSLTTSGEN